MAQGKDPVTDTTGGNRSHQIEAEIDRTRAAMDRTVDAIAGKLTPQQLALEALGVFKDGSSTLATKLVQTAREHPVPATIIGIGIGLLLTEKSKAGAETRSDGRTVGFGSPAGAYQGVSSRYDTGVVARFEVPSSGEGVAAGALHKVEDAAGTVKDKAAGVKDSVAAGAQHAKEKVGETAAQVKEQAAHVKDQVREQAGHLKDAVAEKTSQVKESAAQVPVYARQQWHDAKLGFWQKMDQSPFTIGLAVLAAGVAAGLTVPTSRREDQLMGETRDRLLDQARGATREAMDKGKQVARATGAAVKSEAERQGLGASDIAQKVRTIGREAEQALKSEAERVAPESLKAAGATMPRDRQDDTLPGGAAGRGMSAGFASAGASPAATSGPESPGTGMGSLSTGANATGAGTTGTGNTTGGSMGPTTGTGTKGDTTKT